LFIFVDKVVSEALENFLNVNFHLAVAYITFETRGNDFACCRNLIASSFISFACL